MSHQEDRIAGERDVLACLFARTFRDQPFGLGEVSIDPDDFLDPDNQAIFKAMHQIEKEGGRPDPVLIGKVAGRWGRQVATRCSELMNESISDANLPIHVENLRASIWAHREELLREEASTRLATGHDQEDVAEQIKAQSVALAEKYGGGKKIRTLADAALPLYDAADTRAKNPDAQPSGVDFIDDATVSLMGGEFIALAGYPGTGKSAMALQMARGRSRLGLKTGILSLEMGDRSIAGRLISQVSGVNTLTLMRSPESLSDQDRIEILATKQDVLAVAQNIFIDENFTMDVDQLLSRARVFRAAGARMLIVDYFQLIGGGKGTNKNEQLTDVSRRFKLFAEEKPKTVVVMLSQFSNEAKKKGRMATTTDMRDTGALGQDVDMAMLLHLLESGDYANLVLFDIDKGRNVPNCRIKTVFKRSSQFFAKAAQAEN